MSGEKMTIKEILKSNRFIRNIGKKINIKRQFKQDAIDFSKYYLYSAEENKDFRYSIMLIVHSLEKGMCYTNPRPFGGEKVKELMYMLDSYSKEKHMEFEYKMGISILFSWLDFFKSHRWDNLEIYTEVENYLRDKTYEETVNTGTKEYFPILQNVDSEYYKRFVLSRHSVRDYQERELDRSDINFALRCFVETPTACNRQMCKVVYVENIDCKELLNSCLIGIPGFNKKNVHFFVVTYDLSAFAYSGERQQGMFNAGLCTMNFINGLHMKGIGSCCLQWSNKNDEDIKVRKMLGLSLSERISVVIGAGYYLEKNIIPCSYRRKIDDIFSVV